MIKHNIISGIKASNSLHLGHYLGYIKPNLNKPNHFMCVADLHATTNIMQLLKNGKQPNITEHALDITASLLSFDDNLNVYLQSGVLAIFKLHWYLNCFLSYSDAKRMHAVKSLEDFNLATLNYPVLMTADIFSLNAATVCVGHDQLQHIELAKKIIRRINFYLQADFIVPEAHVATAQLIVGSDGRKMSKSYQNFISPFASRETIAQQIFAYRTDSSSADSAKDYLSCPLFTIFNQLATPADSKQLQQRYQDGISWAEVKQRVYDQLISYFSPYRKKYHYLKNNFEIIAQRIKVTTLKVRKIAAVILSKLERLLKVAQKDF